MEKTVQANSQSIFNHLSGQKSYAPPPKEQLVPITNEKDQKELSEETDNSNEEQNKPETTNSSRWRPW